MEKPNINKMKVPEFNEFGEGWMAGAKTMQDAYDTFLPDEEEKQSK